MPPCGRLLRELDGSGGSRVSLNLYAPGCQTNGRQRPSLSFFTGRRGTESWTVARDGGGDCVFFDRSIGGLCLVHRDLGSGAVHLPAATFRAECCMMRAGR